MKNITLTLIAFLIAFASLAVAPITGVTSICVGSTSPLADADPGGTWSSSDVSIAAVGISTGLVTPVSAGTATITYMVGTLYATTTVTALYSPGAISGASGLCDGTSITLSNGTPGGTWSSSAPIYAIVGSASGIVTGLASGVATISYTLLSTGCSAIHNVTVYPVPTSITGTTTICTGSTSTLACATPGGTWSSSVPGVAIIGSVSGLATGLSVGTTTITYTLGTGCSRTTVVTVMPVPGAISGPSTLCVGASGTLTDPTIGGTWTSSSSCISIDMTTGVAIGVYAALGTVTYTIAGGCSATRSMTVLVTPGATTGASSTCIGSSTTLSNPTSGGYWASSNTAIATIGTSTGIVSGITPGAVTLSYILGTGCSATHAFTVYPTPSVGASSSVASCGGLYTLTATGAVSYSWSPSAGLSCPTCSVTTFNPSGATNFVVTGTNAYGCTDTGMLTVTSNRIYGHVSFGGPTPDTLDMKVWLIQYNPIDSSLTALDSTITCLDGSLPYYEFSARPAGSYLVKGKLIYGNTPGSSGYIPTYGLSSIHWDTAAPITHTTAADSMHITMVYGTVPTGPGFIGGLIISGAGKKTADVPAPGLMVYLKDATTGAVLTYTFTDVTGAYSFTGLGYGSYIAYPADYDYTTTPTPVITLSSTSPSATGRNFRQSTTFKTIKPYTLPTIVRTPEATNIKMVPNPAAETLNIIWENQPQSTAEVVMTDMAGREVLRQTIEITTQSGKSAVQLGMLKNGLYLINIRSASINYTDKLTVQH